MPQIQILPAIPSFGSHLAQALGGAATNIAQGYTERRQSANDQTILEGILKKENPSDMDLIGAYSSLSDKGKAQVQPLIQGLIQRNTAMNVANVKAEAKGAEAREKKLAEEQEKAGEIENMVDTLEELRAKKDYVGSTLYGKSFGAGKPEGERFTIFDIPYNREAFEQREFIDNTGFWITDKIYNKFNKGVITDAKLKLIKDKLAPNSKLSEREYIARINALERVAKLPSNIRKRDFDKAVDKEVQHVEAIKKKKETSEEKPQEKKEAKAIDKATVDAFITQANGDLDEARRLAKEAGYEF